MKSKFIALLIAVCVFIGVIGFCIVKTSANGDDDIEVLEVQGVRVKIKIDPKDKYSEWLNAGDDYASGIVYASYEAEDANGEEVRGSVDVSGYASLNIDDLSVYVSAGSWVSVNNSPEGEANAWVSLPGFAQVTHENGPGRIDIEGDDSIHAFDSHTYNLLDPEDLQKALGTLSAAAYLEVPEIDQTIQIKVEAWIDQGE
ncbi:hypothetical protein C6501_14845 [Candidatus Poribacteria bacterium]|nr:MAG: hypothetical protein C6501_14845 [Candidatus Poribacteria bacterium]